ncbi:MAG TPA: transporter substrate-binding domain-containing protein [Gaiellaceae bacterium]|nr:transporter substrate-binding domain-containing protein [Gaiellaceae bacterium]
MKRLIVLAAALAVAAAALAALAVAKPGGADGRAQTKPAPLPALPDNVKSRKRWVIGVKCDFSPFGYIDVQGNNAGYDVEVARQFAILAFGRPNRISLVCVTTPSRIPALQSSRVDIIISTLTWTKARTEVIDFSIPYYGATGRLAVTKSSSINSIKDLSGKTVVTTRGALYAPWTKLCVPGAKLLEVESPAAAVLAVKNGQADTFMFDDAFLLGVATQDRDMRLTKDKFLQIPWGIGIRKGDTATKRWVDAALRRLQAKDFFYQVALRKNSPKSLVDDFAPNVPRPGKSLRYPEDKDAATDCSVA